jgi:hypothetical protein
MEGSTATAVRNFNVEHDFECSRLEQALLAHAYLRVVPEVRRRIGVRETKTPTSPLNPVAGMHTMARGG